MPDDCLFETISKLNIRDLSNFSRVSIMCKASAELVFEEVHGSRLDLTGIDYKCTTRTELDLVLKQFGHLSNALLINMSTFRDAFDSNEALKWIADSCSNKLKSLQLIKFNLNLESESDARIAYLMDYLEELIIVDGNLAHCGVFFDNGRQNLKSLTVKNTVIDETTKISLESQTGLQKLIVNDARTNSLSFESLVNLLINNCTMEHFQLTTNASMPYSFAKRLMELTDLSYTVTSKNKNWLKNAGIENNNGELSALADLKSLQRLQLSAYKGFCIQPLIDRLVNHDKISELNLSSVRVNQKFFQQLVNFKNLQSIKLFKVVCTESLPRFMKYINQMAAKQLDEIQIVFEHPINMDHLTFVFTGMSFLHTWQVIQKEDYAEVVTELAKAKEKQPNDDDHLIIVWPKGIIWRKHVNDEIEDTETIISISP